MFLAATADSTEMGKFAVRHRAQVPLEALAKNFAVGFVNPVGRPVLGLRLVAYIGLSPVCLLCLSPFFGFLGSLGGVKGVVRVLLGGGGVGVLGRSRPL